jgi:hypothetical protein
MSEPHCDATSVRGHSRAPSPVASRLYSAIIQFADRYSYGDGGGYPVMKPLAVIVMYAAIGVTAARSPKYTSSGVRYSRD